MLLYCTRRVTSYSSMTLTRSTRGREEPTGYTVERIQDGIITLCNLNSFTVNFHKTKDKRQSLDI